MVGSKFDLNGLCFDQLKQRERLRVLFCFPSLVMELGEKNVKSVDSLSLLLDRQLMELSPISKIHLDISKSIIIYALCPLFIVAKIGNIAIFF